MIPPLGFRVSNLLLFRRSLRPPPSRSLSSGAGDSVRQSLRGEGDDYNNEYNNYSYRDRDRRKMYKSNSSSARRDGPRDNDSRRFDEEFIGENRETNQFSRNQRLREGNSFFDSDTGRRRGARGDTDGKGFGPRRGERLGRDYFPFDDIRKDDEIRGNDKRAEASQRQRGQEENSFLEKSELGLKKDEKNDAIRDGKGFGRGDSFPFDEIRNEEKIGGNYKRNRASQEQRLQEGNSFLEKFKLGFNKDEKKLYENPKQEEVQRATDEGPPQDADEIFKKMKETGLIPNAVAMLDGLCKDGLVQEAMKLFGLMREKGTIPEVVIYTAVVDGFCKAQKLDDAIRIFRKMQSNDILPNAFSYTVLVQGLCKGKRLEDALKICVEMLENGHSPNLVTFLGLVDGFCHEKGLEEGKAVISMLREKGFFYDEKGVRQFLDKKGPSVPLVWEAFFGKSSSRASF